MISVLILLVICLLAAGIVYRMRSGFTGLNSTTVLGATDHLMNADKKRAAEVVVRQQSGDLLETKDNGDGHDPSQNTP